MVKMLNPPLSVISRESPITDSTLRYVVYTRTKRRSHMNCRRPRTKVPYVPRNERLYEILRNDLKNRSGRQTGVIDSLIVSVNHYDVVH